MSIPTHEVVNREVEANTHADVYISSHVEKGIEVADTTALSNALDSILREPSKIIYTNFG